MDDDMQFEELEADSAQQPFPSEPEGFDAYRSIVRLLVGLALVGGDDLIGRLREWEVAHPFRRSEQTEAELEGESARRALIGMVFDAAEMVRQATLGAVGLSVSVAGAMWSALRPITSSFLFRPFWIPVRSLATRSEARFERYTRIGRDEEQRSRKLAGDVTGLLIEDIVGYVGDNPGVKALIDAQVERLLPELVDDATIQALLRVQLGEWIAGLATRAETLDPLVQQVGDRYIAYLNEHPDDVRNLVQGQAVGMATEVRDDVRTITVTGDTFLETLARALLRRTPREDLPPPPTDVQRQAVPGRFAGDIRYLKEG